MGRDNYYITTTLPYVNARPHIGFALEIVQADVLARYQALQGRDTYFNTGTDEHGSKIYQRAIEEDKDPQTFVDEYAAKFDDLKKALNLSYNSFIRTTEKRHIRAAKEFWKRCGDNGDIYKGKQKIKYCIGCELEKTSSELVDGRCPDHPNKNIEVIEEENYFFRFSKYQESLLNLYKNNPDFIVPESKSKEIINFVYSGLKDFSVSRLKSKLPWGVEVPNDPNHVMYVWFDALINYISAIGWPDDTKAFNKWWPGVQIAGKDNLRQQSAMWQAMLMSAGLPCSKQIFIHGFITSEGKKMSKSLGNVIDPFGIVNIYGTDALRYYLLREIPAYSDGDFSESRFKQLYNSDLANGIGNLVSRIAKLAEKHNLKVKESTRKNRVVSEISKHIKVYRFEKAVETIWKHLRDLDKYLDENKPWKKEKGQACDILKDAIEGSDSLISIREVGIALKPFLPDTAAKILKQFKGPNICFQNPYFKRI